MKTLAKFLAEKNDFTAEEINLSLKHFSFEVLAPKTFLLKEGQVAHYIYFIQKGIFKSYKNLDSKYVVEHLAGNGRFFTSTESFMKETPSLDNVQTISECEVYKISKPDFQLLITQYEAWKNLFENQMSETLICKMQRLKDFQTLTAKQRYEKFIQEQGEIALEVPIETLASFLGIEPPSLSRIRRQIMLQ
jgi:CRP-like cAMP-binding protein